MATGEGKKKLEQQHQGTGSSRAIARFDIDLCWQATKDHYSEHVTSRHTNPVVSAGQSGIEPVLWGQSANFSAFVDRQNGLRTGAVDLY